MRNIGIWVVAAFLAVTTAVAQQTHSQYEPPNGPGAGQKLLAQFVGNWTFVDTFNPARGKPRVTKGTCKQFMIEDGKFLESDFTFMPDNHPQYTGTGISGFDPGTNRFTTVWIDSERTEMSIRQSDGTFDGKDIVLQSTSLDPDDPGRKTIARAHLENNGHTLVYQHFLEGANGKERMMFEIVMTKE